MRLWFSILMLCTAAAHAETYCSTNAQDLRAQLAFAQNSTEADEIRLAAGTYELDATITFGRFGARTGALILTGGWDDPCSEQTRGAQWTRIEAMDSDIAFEVIASEDILLSDMHFVDFATVSLRNRFDIAEPADVRLSRVAVFSNVPAGDAISLLTPSERIMLDNVLVDADNGCALAAGSFLAGGRLEIFSSTFISRHPDGVAACLFGRTDAALNAATNSVFSVPHGFGILSNSLPTLLRFSAYDEALGCSACDPPVDALHPDSVSNFEQAMAFDETVTSDFARFLRIAKGTAMIPNLRDSGVADPTLLFDVMGNPRDVGGIDRGAFELPVEAIFADGYE